MSIQVHRYYVPDSLQNYNHLVIAGGKAACIDPFNWTLAEQTAQSQEVEITEIWLTHGHGDHVVGVPDHFPGPIKGHPDISRCAVTEPFAEPGSFDFAGHRIEIMVTPGHTFDHLCFFIPEIPALIAGDTLFNAGVGNTRSGDTDTLYQSIQSLKALPDDTQLYNGHDYLPTNIGFTASVSGDTALTRQWRERCDSTTPDNRPVTTLGDERAINLFLQTDQQALRSQLALNDNASDQTVFRALRARRDQW